MLTARGAIEKVLSCIDSEELVPLALDIVSIPTPTRSEREVAKFIEDWLKRQGIEALRQEMHSPSGGSPANGRLAQHVISSS